jgi:hypothetical protein
MSGGSIPSQREIGLDCRSAQMAAENCFGGLKLDALVVAVQEFAQALDREWGQIAQRCLDHLWDTRPAARIGAATRQPMSKVVPFHDGTSFFFGASGHLEGTSSLPEARHGENWRAAG